MRGKVLLAAELALFFVAGPFALYLWGTRTGIYAGLWGSALYALWQVWRQPGFAWKNLWEGQGWDPKARRAALLRFLAAALLMTGATLLFLPQRFLAFPFERPVLWLLVMVLYPILSVVPQEIFFRSFFMERYAPLLGRGWLLILSSGLTFGFSHLILNNWVAPLCTAIGGALFATSYGQHRSLKWAVTEHALYGCFVFTIGFGWFFYTGNWRP